MTDVVVPNNSNTRKEEEVQLEEKLQLVQEQHVSSVSRRVQSEEQTLSRSSRPLVEEE